MEGDTSGNRRRGRIEKRGRKSLSHLFFFLCSAGVDDVKEESRRAVYIRETGRSWLKLNPLLRS